MGKRSYIIDILTDSAINKLKAKDAQMLKFILEANRNEVDSNEYNKKMSLFLLMNSFPHITRKNENLKWYDDSSNEYDFRSDNKNIRLI